MIATLSFFIENVYNRYIILLANDTPSFVTWRSRLATASDTPTVHWRSSSPKSLHP